MTFGCLLLLSVVGCGVFAVTCGSGGYCLINVGGLWVCLGCVWLLVSLSVTCVACGAALVVVDSYSWENIASMDVSC